ncbi:MAG: GNAT family N-acetyltransferase [Synergistaceae bacterium]|nr:GNAT family N-acetyltransferase [Synergistaceae bacterium]
MFVPEIRFCDSSDLPALLELNAVSACPWPESVIAGDLKKDSEAGISYLGAFATSPGAALLGYAVLGRDSKKAGLLMGLIVRAEYRRRGIGSQLLSAVGDCAVYLGFARLKLKVRRSNAVAQSLYRGMSFAQDGVIRGYYSNGEDAILMSARLPFRGMES